MNFDGEKDYLKRGLALSVLLWLRGFGCRLLFVVQAICILPIVILYILLSPIWWLFTGRPLDPPKWAERIMFGGGGYDGFY